MAHISQKLNRRNQTNQTGFVMIVTLIALVIMLLASVALIKSTDANLQIAGNMAFKRDLINQAERTIPNIQARFKASGALSGDVSRESDNPANNYSATILASNNSGIPQVLLDMDTNANNIQPSDGSNVLIRYVIDRMCLSTGPADDKYCTLAVSNSAIGGSDPKAPGGQRFPVYRITIRATGPRNTEAYMQTTYSD